jgi:galactokinase
VRNENALLEIVSRYRDRFGSDPDHLVAAPGRVNLIGEHTDYNGGWVLPFAIDRYMRMAISEGKDRSVLLAVDRGESVEFDSRELPPPRPGHWSNYLLGVLAQFKQAGYDLPQVNACFTGDIPEGGGLSSSAALENCMALALDRLTGARLTRESMALYSQAAEHEYAGVLCGIMDQFSTLLCERGNALLLDCRTRAYRQVPLRIHPYRFVLCNSMVKHELAESGYNDRRKECESALGKLREGFPDLLDLRDCPRETLEVSRDRLTQTEYRRVLHQVDENIRVMAAVGALRDGDLGTLGILMAASHASLSGNFQVSSPEQDFLVAEALQRGALGARMTGGGFGGNVLCLIHEDRTGDFMKALSASFRQAFGLDPEIWECAPGDGAFIVTAKDFAEHGIPVPASG